MVRQGSGARRCRGEHARSQAARRGRAVIFQQGRTSMIHRSIAWLAGLLFGASLLAAPLAAQQAPGDLKARTNRGTIGIISGGVDGTYIRIAADLANVLEEPDSLRILPVIGKGSVQNLADLP